LSHLLTHPGAPGPQLAARRTSPGGRLVVFGAGDIARLALRYFETDSPYEVVAFTVDAAHRTSDTFRGLPLIDWEGLPKIYPPSDVTLFVALSYRNMNRLRAEKYQAARDAGYVLASYVSSRCTWLSEHAPGDNCFVLEDNTVQQGVRVGNDVTLWSGNHIGHDATIGDHCFVASHVVVSGHVRIGAYCFLGVNSAVRDSVTLGARTLVGAGVALMANAPEGSVWVPPRPLRLDRDSSEIAL
jgi:sugar O-acyltransferase (sialic acid O-acetyltransferase NeuD family)